VSEPVQLKVAESSAQEDTIKLLREMLADAEAGNILSMVAIVTRPDSRWSSLAAGIGSSFEMAGMIGSAWLEMQVAMRSD
jgi:hypothetical protein